MKQNLRFGLVLGWLAVLKISGIMKKYASFEGNFFMGKKELENKTFGTFDSIRTIIIIKLRKP